MLPIEWTKKARLDLSKIIAHISEFNPDAAEKMQITIEDSILPVAEFPRMYKEGRVPGTHERVAHPNYIVVYKVKAEFIEVVSVKHSRQKYPKS